MSTPLETPKPRTRWYGLVLEVFGIVLLILVLGALFFPVMRTGNVREAARRTYCSNNLHNIMLALRGYVIEHGTLPPAYTTGANGRRLHSWRTLILPYLELRDLYDSIDLSKPWNDPANAQALHTQLPIYECPSAEVAPGMTTYLACTGENAFLDPVTQRRISDITKELVGVTALIDVPTNEAVSWMSPYDADEACRHRILQHGRSPHDGIFMVTLADGSDRPEWPTEFAESLTSGVSIHAQSTDENGTPGSSDDEEVTDEAADLSADDGSQHSVPATSEE